MHRLSFTGGLLQRRDAFFEPKSTENEFMHHVCAEELLNAPRFGRVERRHIWRTLSFSIGCVFVHTELFLRVY